MDGPRDATALGRSANVVLFMPISREHFARSTACSLESICKARRHRQLTSGQMDRRIPIRPSDAVAINAHEEAAREVQGKDQQSPMHDRCFSVNVADFAEVGPLRCKTTSHTSETFKIAMPQSTSICPRPIFSGSATTSSITSGSVCGSTFPGHVAQSHVIGKPHRSRTCFGTRNRLRFNATLLLSKLRILDKSRCCIQTSEKPTPNPPTKVKPEKLAELARELGNMPGTLRRTAASVHRPGSGTIELHSVPPTNCRNGHRCLLRDR